MPEKKSAIMPRRAKPRTKPATPEAAMNPEMDASDGSAINTIACAHGAGVAETTSIGAGGDHGRAPTGEAGDARDAGHVEGFGHAHRRQDGRQAARQPRCPRARRTQEKDVGVRMPASRSALPQPVRLK
jgi:hypothetical protein